LNEIHGLLEEGTAVQGGEWGCGMALLCLRGAPFVGKWLSVCYVQRVKYYTNESIGMPIDSLVDGLMFSLLAHIQ
jgi:hypothetical protein